MRGIYQNKFKIVNIKDLQEVVCKDCFYAIGFVESIKEVDIQRCMEIGLKSYERFFKKINNEKGMSVMSLFKLNKLNKLINILKTAQENTISDSEIVALKNHIIRINKNSQELYDYIQPLADSNYITQDGISFLNAKTHANNLKTFSIHLTNAIQTDKPFEKIREIYNKVFIEFEEISKKYLKDNWVQENDYKPMKEIKESLIVIKNLLDKY